MFSDAEVTPFFPAAQRGDNPLAGHRVDWDFVVDHRRTAVNHDQNGGTPNVEFGVEGLGNGTDQHGGIESMLWLIGNTAPSPQPAPDANNGGKDKTGLGTFGARPDFAGASFRYADVFSLSTTYSDQDTNAAGGLTLIDGALDYDLFFLGLDNQLYAGSINVVFQQGWTTNTLVDNYLARWVSPVDAKGIYILGHVGDGHDGTAQIDAILVSTVPEPATVGGLCLVLIGLMNRVRRARAAAPVLGHRRA
jgi:hypothetical protein